jgi:hypothetical protein
MARKVWVNKKLKIYRWVGGEPKKKHFTIEVHHKHEHLLPDWMLNDPDTFSIANTFRKRGGPHRGGPAFLVRLATTHAWVLVNHKGMTQRDAVNEAARAIREHGWVDRKRKGKLTKIETTIDKNLSQNRGRLTDEDIKIFRADTPAGRADENL